MTKDLLDNMHVMNLCIDRHLSATSDEIYFQAIHHQYPRLRHDLVKCDGRMGECVIGCVRSGRIEGHVREGVLECIIMMTS